MSIVLKRTLLAVAALVLFGLAAWMDVTAQAAWRGQDDATDTPTVTPTRPPLRTEIAYPQSGDILVGTVDIEGTALANNFIQYQLHIAVTGSENWQWLTTVYIFLRDRITGQGKIGIVRDGVLYSLDTTRWPDGFYDLRLRAIRYDGNYDEFVVRAVEIRNQNPPTPTPDPNAPDPSSITPTPTATPTPDITSFIPGSVGIYEPRHGDKVHGYMKIMGTANAPTPYYRFDRYELFISPAGMQQWSWLYTGREQHYQDTLYVLDTARRLENGFYDLRLRIVYRDSNYSEFFVYNLEVDNRVRPSQQAIVEFTAPEDGAAIHGQVDIMGTIVHPQFQRWELYWSRSGYENWVPIFSADYQVVDELIARIDVGRMPVASYDVRLRVIRRDGNYDDYYIRRLHVIVPTPTPVYPWR